MPFSFLSSIFQRVKKMTSGPAEEQGPALTDRATKTNGTASNVTVPKRRDLKTVINYADQETYLKWLAEAGGKFDLTQGPEVSVPLKCFYAGLTMQVLPQSSSKCPEGCRG
jgi:hypothetical protein